jgi:hypothetical protein
VHNGRHEPVEPLVATRFQETAAAVSPDGRWLAFVADYSGVRQVYVRPLGSDAAQTLVSLDGGDEPVWSRDGRELFYRGSGSEGSELMVARVETAPEFRVTARRALFPMEDMAPSVPHANYDVSADGRTFVMVRLNPASRIMVIQNLPELVRRLQRRAQGAG